MRTIFLCILFCAKYTFVFTQATYDNLEGLPYLLSAFQPGKLYYNNGNIQDRDVNYYLITGELVVLINDRIVPLTLVTTLDSVVLDDMRFVKVEDRFYELVYEGSVDLLVFHKEETHREAEKGAYGTQSQTAKVDELWEHKQTQSANYSLEWNDAFKRFDKSEFLLYDGEILSPAAKLNDYSLVFGKSKKELKAYVSENDIKFNELSSVKQFVRFCDTQL